MFRVLRIWLFLSLASGWFSLSVVNAACPNLNLSFTITGGSACGVPQNFTLTNTSTGSAASSTIFYWVVNGVRIDSATGVNTRIYAALAPGNYTFRLVARTAANCLDSFTRTPVTISSNAPAVNDGNNQLSFSPVWRNCIINPLAANTFNINISSNDTLSNYTIIWGDVSANSTGAQLLPGASVSHSYNTLGLFNVKIITVNGLCTDTLNGTVINMRPVSTAIRPLTPGQLAGCAPHSITFQDTSVNSLPGTIFTWNFGDGTIITRDWTQANQPISHVYPKEASQQCVFTVSLTAFNPNCNTGNPSTYSISPILIFDEDIPAIGVPPVLCNPLRTYTFQNNSAENCITGQRLYYWDFGDGTNTGWITSKASQTHTFPTLGSYTIMLIDSNGCGSDTDYATININQPPVAGFTANPKSGCQPLNVSFSDISLGIGNTRVWNFQGTTPISANTINVSRTYNNPGTFIATLTVSNICASNVVVRDTIRVYAKPNVSIGNALSGCAPHSISLQNNTTNQSPQATYFWSFGNGDTSTQRVPPVVTYNSPGTYQVKLVVTDSCGTDSQMVNIVVSTIPVADFSSTTVCRGDTTRFTNLSALAPGDQIAAFRWYFGNGDSATVNNPGYIYPADGIFQAVLKITTDKNCIDYDTASVTVNISPVVSINNTPASVCNGTIVNFDGTATTASGSITAYQWTFGSGITDTARTEDTVYLFPSPGTYAVRLKVSNSTGCSFTQLKNISINPVPDAKLGATNACFGQQTQLRDSSVVGFSNTISQWFWDVNDDGVTDFTSQHPQFTFPSASTFKVKLRAGTNNNCFDTDSILVSVNQIPVPAISSNTNSLCKQDSFLLSNTTTGAVSYRWVFGDLSADLITVSQNDFKKAFTDSGSFQVKMIASTANGCKDSSTITLLSRPFPEAIYTTNDTAGCAPKLFTFNNTSTSADHYRWFINGLERSNAIHLPDTTVIQSGQVFSVTLIATNNFGCKPDTTSQVLYTLSNPQPAFALSTDSGCGPLAVNTLNSSSNALGYTWLINNQVTGITNNISASFLPSAINDSVYRVKLIASNGPGCKDSTEKTVKVFPLPESRFTPSVTNGCGPLSVNFNNTSQHFYGGNFSDLTFNWNFGDGTQSSTPQPAHVLYPSLTRDTVYNLTLITTTLFGCKDTTQQSIRVYPKPTASFNITNQDGCGPLSTSFTNASIPNDTGNIQIMTFNWKFGNGLVSSTVDPAATFVANAVKDTIYQVWLTAYSEHGCADSINKAVRVYPKPLSSFAPSDSSGCGPLAVQFNNLSTPFDTGSIHIMSFIWDMGNGFNSILTSPQSQYLAASFTDTTYTVKLFATSEHGCRDTSVKTIVVHPKPVASFSSNQTQGCGPLTVQFTNHSLLSTQFNWAFGAGASSPLPSPAYTFVSAPLLDSVYDVKLTTQSAFGCRSDTAKTTIIVKYDPVADFVLSSDSICGAGAVAFFNTSSGGTSNQWNFGNGQVSSSINPVSFFPALPAVDTTYHVRLIVTTTYLCRDTVVKPLKVNPLPEALFATVLPGCTPLPVAFNNNSNRGVKYEWDFGDGTTDSAINATKTFTNDVTLVNRNYLVTLKAYSASGCMDTARQQIVVYPQPFASFSELKSNKCDSAEYNFTNNSIGAAAYQWNFGDGAVSTNNAPTHIYPSSINGDTSYNTQLIAITANGCRDTSFRSVLVHPLVTADFGSLVTTACGSLVAQFNNTSTHAGFYFWNFGDGSGSQLLNPSHHYLNSGDYDVTLIAYDPYGCSDTMVKPGFVEVYEVPVSSYIFTPSETWLPESVIIFDNLSSISGGVLSYDWSFGEPPGSLDNTSGLKNPSHTYADSGSFTASLIVISDKNCRDTIEKKVRINYYKPVASFTLDPDTGCAPHPVQFTNTSQYAQSYLWNFGDNKTSTDEHPVHTYLYDGVYTVLLRATGPGGEDDTIRQDVVVVNGLPRANFFATPTTAYLPDATIYLTNTSYDNVLNKWSVFETGKSPMFTSNDQDPVFRFNEEGKFTVMLEITSDKGCKDTLIREELIEIFKGGDVFVPDAFTPDGDGLNEVFIPVITGVNKLDYTFRVFDRWGTEVFKTMDPKEGWDGKVNGKFGTADVYVWVAEGSFIGGGTFTKKGTITLLR